MNATRRHPGSTRGAPARPTGFTLIEVLVTISIIALLVGIITPVAIRMLAQAEVGKTKAVLNALSGALDEYKLQTGNVPDHTRTTGVDRIDGLVVSDDDEDDTTIGLVLVNIQQLGGTAESMLRAGVGRQGLSWDADNDGHDSDDQNPPDFQTAVNRGQTTAYLDLELWTLLDPWDAKMRYAKRVSHEDSFEEDDFLPVHPTPFFASAGPDGVWGSAKLLAELKAGTTLSDEDRELAEAAEDNIVSFEFD